MKKSTTRTLLAPIALIGALTLTACNQGEQAAFEEPTIQQSSSPTEQQTAAAGSDVDADDDTAQAEDGTDTSGARGTDVAVAPASPVPEAIATVTVPAVLKRDSNATLDISIHNLERQDNVLMGTFSFTLNTEVQDVPPTWLYRLLNENSWEPYFIDTVNLTRHDVIGTPTTKARTTSQGASDLRPGVPFYGYAAFALPPEDVESVMVNLADGMPLAEVALP